MPNMKNLVNHLNSLNTGITFIIKNYTLCPIMTTTVTEHLLKHIVDEDIRLSVLHHNAKYLKHKEHTNFLSRNHKKYNIEYRARESERLARLKKERKLSNVAWANKELIAEVHKARIEKELETGIKHHVDHIIPIKGDIICGLNVHYNLRVIPASENMSKSNRYTDELLDILHYHADVKKVDEYDK